MNQEPTSGPAPSTADARPPQVGAPEVSPAGAYRMRVAVALGDTLLRDTIVAGRFTVGESDDADLVVPSAPGQAPVALAPIIVGSSFVPLPGFAGRLHLGGQTSTLDELRASGRAAIDFGPEDWGVVYPLRAPGLRLVVQRVPAIDLRLGPSRWWRDPLWGIFVLVAIGWGFLRFASMLSYEAHRGEIEAAVPSDRMARVMFNKPPEEEKEEKAPERAKEGEKDTKESKRAGGEEGKFGLPNRTGKSSAPKSDAHAKTANLAMVGALNQTSNTAVMQDLLGVGAAIANTPGGVGDELVVGYGSGGMGLVGTGSGGGGEGEGTIMGSGDIDMGGAGSETRKKKDSSGPKAPKEKTPTVQPGKASVKGQLSKELIDQEVRRHKAQIKFCYNKQLQRFPELAGKVTLSWIITMDGSVMSAKVKNSSLGSTDAESCMVRSLQSWKFPKPQGGVVQVDYPFMFGTQ